MSILASNLKFLASERMIDNLSTVVGVGGGGKPGTVVVQDGAENNVFPDVMPADRVAGVTQYRLVYPAALSNDNDQLAGAKSGLIARPTDANVEVFAFPALSDADANLLSGNAQSSVRKSAHWAYGDSCQANATSSSTATIISGTVPQVGELVSLRWWTTEVVYAEGAVVTAVAGSNITWTPAVGTITNGSQLRLRRYVAATDETAARPSSVSLSTGATSAGATSIPVDRLKVRIEPPGSTFPSSTSHGAFNAVHPVGAGFQMLYFPGDTVLIEHASTPTTRELAVVNWVSYEAGNFRIHFTAPLANAFASGSKVTRPIDLGPVQAAVTGAPFVQQTWTRAWADVASGGAINSKYNGTIAMSNEGAITDRWAIVFSSSTVFNLLSERLGQVASGNVASNFIPLNPARSQPYFTLAASGWGSGWLPGNTFRFNTKAAAAPLWVGRCVSPGAPGGTNQATLFIRGDVNA